MELLLGGYPIHSGAVPVHADPPLLCSWRDLPLRAMMDKGDEGGTWLLIVISCPCDAARSLQRYSMLRAHLPPTI